VTATPAGPPPQPPPLGPQPPQLGRVPVDFDRVRLRGPASLGARRLMRLVRTPLAKRGAELEQAPASEEFEATEPVKLLDCAGLCGPAISVGLPLGSPGTTKPFSCCSNGQPDPQIAASNSYLVLGNRDTVWFYDKAGKQLYTKAAPPPSSPSARGAISNKSYPYTVPLCKLFRPLIPHMNAALDSTLPHQLDDPDGNAINVQNGYGLNCAR
jgi:hypothetical protein